MTTIALIVAGLAVLYFFRRGSATASAAASSPALRTNADAAYSRVGNQAPSTITASSNASASGIGTSDYFTGAPNNSPYVSKSTSGFVYPNHPMVDDTNTAAGCETLQYVDPFHDESGN